MGLEAFWRRSLACAGVSGLSGCGDFGTTAQPASAARSSNTRDGRMSFIFQSMKRLPFDSGSMARVLALAALLAAFSAGAQKQAALPTTTVKVAGHALKVEIVANDEDRARGLMFREKLGRDDGMLFVFPEVSYHSMWMKNTLIPLSVAFIDAQGTILNIRDMEPHSLDSHMSAGPALYAIETNKGWFASKNVKAGDKVTGLPKAK